MPEFGLAIKARLAPIKGVDADRMPHRHWRVLHVSDKAGLMHERPGETAEQTADESARRIEAVGAETRAMAARYEALFTDLRAAVRAHAITAADPAAAAAVANLVAGRAAEALHSAFPRQRAMACRTGCAMCCHLQVHVPPQSAFLIARHITEHVDAGQRAALMRRLEAAVAALNAAADPSQVRQPCALLGPDNACMVYAVRPLSCRAFTSVSAERCRTAIFETTSGSGAVEQDPGHFRFFAEATIALLDAAEATGRPGDQADLCVALLAILNDPDLERRWQQVGVADR